PRALGEPHGPRRAQRERRCQRPEPVDVAEILRARSRGGERRVRRHPQQPRRGSVSAEPQHLLRLLGGVLMTITIRHLSALLLVGAGMAAGACNNMDVQNLNAPTSETLTSSPSRDVLARAAIGVQTQVLN